MKKIDVIFMIAKQNFVIMYYLWYNLRNQIVMREYTKKPESQSRTLDSNPKASRQAPIDVILQRYKERNIQRFAEDEELIQGKFDTAQREKIDEDELLQGKFKSVPTDIQKSIQREERPNNTGLPDNLKTGIENLSGYSMDDVQVHYNSSKPAQLNALAYAQGTDIHVAPGQEKHLPHEAWHVVQQMQGRIQSTMQMQGVNVNDNEVLEREADNMGEKSKNRDLYGLNSRNSSSYFCNSSTKQLKIRVASTIFPREGKDHNEEVDYIYLKLLANKFISFGKKHYSYIDETIDHKLYIKELLEKDETITERSYASLVNFMWKYISSKLVPPLPPPISTFIPFSKEAFSAASSTVGAGPASIFRPSSPIREKRELIRDWKIDHGSHHFMIRGSDTDFDFGGSGKFLHQAGSYEDLISSAGENVFVEQLQYLLLCDSEFDATKIHPSVKAAYALIVAVEGCARSMHNIGVTAIFLRNYDTIKSIYKEKGLLELMNMFLTFSPEGGAASSKDYIVNEHELKLIAAHLQANSINTDDTISIGEHLAGIVSRVLDLADLRSTISTE